MSLSIGPLNQLNATDYTYEKVFADNAENVLTRATGCNFCRIFFEKVDTNTVDKIIRCTFDKSEPTATDGAPFQDGDVLELWNETQIENFRFTSIETGIEPILHVFWYHQRS